MTTALPYNDQIHDYSPVFRPPGSTARNRARRVQRPDRRWSLNRSDIEFRRFVSPRNPGPTMSHGQTAPTVGHPLEGLLLAREHAICFARNPTLLFLEQR